MSGYEKSRIVGMTEKDLDEFTCSICQEVFNDPVVTQCCRQTYCKACIKEWLTKQNTCPNDRKVLGEDDLSPPPRFATNFLNNMRIKCENEEKGCEVITTISEMYKHLTVCDHNGNCKTCGLEKLEDQEHNCVANLVIKNESIMDGMNKLKEEIQQLKRANHNMKQKMDEDAIEMMRLRKTIDELQSNKKTSSASSVLELARNSLHSFVVLEQTNITPDQREVIMNKCIEGIVNKDSFRELCISISHAVNRSRTCRGQKYWHVIAYSADRGEYNVYSDQFLCVRFEKLIIQAFTLKECPSTTNSTNYQ